jgi:hypothetical protein
LTDTPATVVDAKTVATLKARAALAGWELTALPDGSFVASRWGMHRNRCRSLPGSGQPGDRHLMSAIFPPESLESPPDDDVTQLRTPPHSEQAEQSVLGGLLIDGAALASVTETLAINDFYAHAHRQIYAAMIALGGSGKAIDVITVFDELGDKAETAGGLKYLNDISQSVPSTSNLPRYCEIVKERSILRQVLAIADVGASRAFKNDSAAQLLDDMKVQLGRLQEQSKLGSGRMPVLSLGELEKKAHATRWLIKHVIPADSVGMFFGGSGAFKSFITLDAALHVAHGMPWLGRRTQQGPVVFIAAEGGAGLWKRIAAWHRARKLQMGDVPLYVIPVAVDLRNDAWRVVEAVQALGITPALVVVDTVSQTFTGEENSASDMAAYLQEVGNRFRALWHCAVALIHHSGHLATDRPRGSSTIVSNIDWLHGVFRDGVELLATLTNLKQKDGELFKDATFSLTTYTVGTDEDGDKVTSLVARHLANVEEMQEAMEAEQKAGRGGKNQLLLTLLDNGALEADVRKLFYEQCGLDNVEARRQAYNRARKWVVSSGLAEFAAGHVVLLNTGAQP